MAKKAKKEKRPVAKMTLPPMVLQSRMAERSRANPATKWGTKCIFHPAISPTSKTRVSSPACKFFRANVPVSYFRGSNSLWRSRNGKIHKPQIVRYTAGRIDRHRNQNPHSNAASHSGRKSRGRKIVCRTELNIAE